MFCFNCGKPIAEDSKFCTHCGTRLQRQAGPTRRRLRLGRYIFLIFGLLALMALRSMIPSIE